nr:MAG TPA: hypothetical protein [Caudoviricetes sp.]
MSLAREGVTVYFANVAPRVSDGASALYGIRAHALTPALLGPDGAGVSAYLGGGRTWRPHAQVQRSTSTGVSEC